MFQAMLMTCAILFIAAVRGDEPTPGADNRGYNCNPQITVNNEYGRKPLPVETTRPVDCQDVQSLGSTTTGTYKIYPKGTSGFPVQCDMTSDEGGWTVIQRRINKSDFYLGWLDYQTGFGDLETNFWLGNLQIHSITSQGWYELRIDMIGPNDEVRYAKYDVFSVGGPDTKYQLLLGKYSGDAGDSFSYANGAKFTTKDQDNDIIETLNCAVHHVGAWWYTSCHVSNLNGDYGNTDYADGVVWNTLTTHYKSLKRVEMKIRRWSR